MEHETPWHCRAAGEAPSMCGSALEGWPDVVCGSPAIRRIGEFGVSVVASLSTGGAAGPAAPAHTRATVATVRGPKADPCETAGAGPTESGLSDRCLDPGAGGRIDPPRVRDSISLQPRLESADRAGLELPEARAPRRGTGRGSHRSVEAPRLAADKKTAHDVAPISSSSMRAGFCLSPTCAGPGHREDRHRVCAIATVMTGSRSAVGWRCRPRGDDWRSIFAVARTISPASTSGPSSTIFSGTCTAPSTCSGTAARSTGVVKSRHSSPSTRACMSMASRRTLRNSIQRSMSGHRLIRLSPTARLMTWPISGSGWTPLSAVFDAPSPSSGPASTPRTAHGLGK